MIAEAALDDAVVAERTVHRAIAQEADQGVAVVAAPTKHHHGPVRTTGRGDHHVLGRGRVEHHAAGLAVAGIHLSVRGQSRQEEPAVLGDGVPGAAGDDDAALSGRDDSKADVPRAGIHEGEAIAAEGGVEIAGVGGRDRR